MYVLGDNVACRYTSFVTCNGAPVADIVVNDSGVISGGGEDMSLRNRRGIVEWKMK